MIKLEHVSKYFNKNKGNEIRAIDDTSITLPDKGLVTFLGPSGCGKTTLLNAIGGLDNVDIGNIILDGERITRRSSSARDEIRNANIGYIFQNYNLIEDATVYANVSLALRMTGFTNKAAIEERVMYILDRLGIARYRNRPVNMLSGGERQRVGIARAIVKNPRIVIADEPTGNLDSSNTIEIMNIIKAISRDKLVILVTHERQIAEFYADRIIEIIDGKIVADRENEHEGSLDYRIDSRIYLKDMAHYDVLVPADAAQAEQAAAAAQATTVAQAAAPPAPRIELYSDNVTEVPPIKIAVRNGNIYIDTGGRLAVGQENVEMLDEHYEGLSRDVMDKYEFEYEDVYRGTDPTYNDPANQTGVPSKAKYRTIFGPWLTIKAGFAKVAGYSRLKKILLLGFALAAVFVIYAMSNVIGVHTITDDMFIDSNRNYLAARVGYANPANYAKYAEDPEVDYVLPGSGTVAFAYPIDNYEQASWNSATVYAVVTDKAQLSEENLILGRLPEATDEIVLDKMLASSMLRSATVKELGMVDIEELLGGTLKHSQYVPDFTIVGISDTVQPVAYVDKSLLTKLCIYDMGMYVGNMMYGSLSTGQGEFAPAWYLQQGGDEEKYLVEGEYPTADYEVLVPDYYKGQVKIGDAVDRLNGNPLIVTGFYHDDRGGGGYYTTDNTVLENYLQFCNEITISPVNKEDALELLDDGSYQIVDLYEESRESYMDSARTQMRIIELMAAIIIIISLIEIYLILRASFLSRIKEVGVLRAVGLKKGDIYRMFSGEVLAITLITALPGMAIMAYILRAVSTVVGSYKMNIWIFLGSFLIVLVFNMLAGLLPVFRTLRKTPAEILARNDVN